jgi:hypothetical protein
MLPSGRTPSGHVASLLSISLRSVPPGFNRVFQSLVSLTFSFRFMVLVYEPIPVSQGFGWRQGICFFTLSGEYTEGTSVEGM